ncbi:T9SS type A sorting domain-containing protein [Kaistella sp. DKR-2]|uniref:T9SS type A sorting domain-containing protein n=1 Tax=Kaistella soli TaxID=2849654 RepID=UPI001C27C7CF|nr:T9SS type A sorting domain-containing protein [Kaistella soli]MBU8883988.1 T9SS type A sorting domain-containing protein [Kaistella soli]
MKKTLLLMLVGVMSTTFTMKAQIALPKTWDFANDTTNWPLNSGTGVADKTIDQLGLFSKGDGTITNFGAITATSYTYTDGYSGVNRLQLNGAGYPSSGFTTTPSQRYLYFDVSGPVTVTVWFRSGSNSSARTVFVTDGSTVLGQRITDAAGTGEIFTAKKTSAGTERLYVYGDSACNISKITVTATTLATGESAQAAEKVFTNGKTVYVSKVSVPTAISVYTMNGALVNSLHSKSDVSFDLKPGIYLVNTTSVKGSKSQKVIVK